MLKKTLEFVSATLLVMSIAGITATGTYIIREDLEYLMGDHRAPVILELPVPVETAEKFDIVDYLVVTADGSLVDIDTPDKLPEGTIAIIEIKFNWGTQLIEDYVYIDFGNDVTKSFGFQFVGVDKVQIAVKDLRTEETQGF